MHLPDDPRAAAEMLAKLIDARTAPLRAQVAELRTANVALRAETAALRDMLEAVARPRKVA